jgi:hypothetical protein
VPTVGRLAVVTAALAVPKPTVAGPLTWLQARVRVLVGRPSSVTTPFRLAVSVSDRNRF